VPEPGDEPEVRDTPERWEIVSTQERYSGPIFDVRTDRVRMPGGGPDAPWEVVGRDIVRHPGAVAILALDDAERVLMIRQYRHPVERRLWEVPAGLRDVAGEPLHATAARELAEEAGYRAREWRVLVDLFTSPGMTDERMRIFLATGLEEIPEAERHFVREHEEAELVVAWVPLADAVAKVFGAEIHNQQAAMGILAAYAARADGYGRLRPAGAPED
jgi:ADP-ribose pyrophosphatase